MKRVGWILNLDVELEMARPDAQPASARHQEQVRRHGRRYLDGVNLSGQAAGYSHATWDALQPWDHVLTWCPTPKALRALGGDGAAADRAPSLQCLQLVNNRRFLTSLTDGLPGSKFVTTMDQLAEHLSATRTPPDGWLLKRGFGFSGRWRKRIQELSDDATQRWCEASMQDYGAGLQVEPFVPILAEFTRHGVILDDGTILPGSSTSLQCDPEGAWIGNQPHTGALTQVEEDEFDQAFARAASALGQAGYHGPFGIDGFRWRDPAGQTRWQPLSDLNARFTMGFFVGMHRHHQQVVESLSLS